MIEEITKLTEQPVHKLVLVILLLAIAATIEIIKQ